MISFDSLAYGIDKGVPLIASGFGRKAFDIRESSITVTIPYNQKHRSEAEAVDNWVDKSADKL